MLHLLMACMAAQNKCEVDSTEKDKITLSDAILFRPCPHGLLYIRTFSWSVLVFLGFSRLFLRALSLSDSSLFGSSI